MVEEGIESSETGSPETPPKAEEERKTEVSREKKETEKVSVEEEAERLAKSLGGAADAADRLIVKFNELYRETGNLSVAFKILSTQIAEGAIEDPKQLDKVLRWFEERHKAESRKIDKADEKAKKAARADNPEMADEAEEESKESVKNSVDNYDQNYESFREVVRAAVKEGLAEVLAEQGMAGMPPGMTTLRRYEKGKEEEDKIWFEEQLRRVEERDQSFGENWRMIWPMETYLSSIPVEEKEAKKFYDELAQKFEDRRRLHDFRWLYGRTGGTDPILEASSILSTGAVERILKKEEDVAKAMHKFQGLAEMVFDNKGEIGVLEKMIGEAEDKGNKNRKKELENQKEMFDNVQQSLISLMGRVMKGEVELETWALPELRKQMGELKGKKEKFDIGSLRTLIKNAMMAEEDLEKKVKGIKDEKEKERLEKEFEDRLSHNRLGGRLFVVLGFTASYDIDDFASGDFFVGRLIHLKSRFKSLATSEKKRWYGRDKLWKRFRPELWGDGYAGGLLANVLGGVRDKDKALGEFGLKLLKEEERKEKDGRQKIVLRIDNPDKLRNLDFSRFGIEKETSMVDWADSVWKADQMRKLLIGVSGYLDRPTMENFLKLGERLDHLKGDKRWQLFAGMYHDLADFYTGPGFLEKLAKGNFFKRYNVRDPETGELKKRRGISFVGADSEDFGYKGWSMGEVHKMAELAQQANMITKPYVEQILRDKIRLLHLPGYGPLRFTREFIDYLGPTGFLAIFLAPLIEFAQQLRRDLESSYRR